MKNISTYKFLATLLLILLNIFLSQGVFAQTDYPLAVGNSWVYSPSYGVHGDRVDTILGIDTVNGELAYIKERLEAPDDNYNDKKWLVDDGTTVSTRKFWDSDGLESLIDPPWLEWDSQIQVGDTDTQQWNLGDISLTITYYVESLTDTVTVPAGTFQDCVRVRSLIEVTRDSIIEFDYERWWGCPGVGPVLFVDYDDNWSSETFRQELISYDLWSGPVFIDTFEDSDFTNAHWQTFATQVDQTWSFIGTTDQLYHVSAAAGTGTPATKVANNATEYEIGDLYMEVLVRIDSHADAMSVQNTVGAFFGAAEDGTGYSAGIQIDYEGETEIDLFLNSINNPDLASTPVAINFDTFYKLVVQVDENQDISVSLYNLDGTLLGSVSSPHVLPQSHGVTGISGHYEATFNNFYLSGHQVAEAVPASTPLILSILFLVLFGTGVFLLRRTE